MAHIMPLTAPPVVQCPICGGWFQAVDPPVSCCVVHAAGTCCHVGEKRMLEPKPLLPSDDEDAVAGR